MKARITLLLSFLFLSLISCADEPEMDKAIDEAMREKDFDRPGDESASIRYYTEDKAR